MQLNPALHATGNAEEMLELYRSALGGKVEITRYDGTPAAADNPPEMKNKVLYGVLHSPQATSLQWMRRPVTPETRATIFRFRLPSTAVPESRQL